MTTNWFIKNSNDGDGALNKKAKGATLRKRQENDLIWRD